MHDQENGFCPAADKYLDSPEYTGIRGINGSAVAEKVAYLRSRKQRELILFLQGLSIHCGGVRLLAEQILAEFPERVGTPTMLEIKRGADSRYTAEEYEDIQTELHGFAYDAQELLQTYYCDKEPVPWEPVSVREVQKECLEMARERLPVFLTELCVNPRLEFIGPGEDKTAEPDRLRILAKNRDLSVRDFKTAEVSYFRDIVGALYEFQQRHDLRVRSQFVETSISKRVFDALDDARAVGKMSVIEGNSRIGKTTAAKCWSEAHLGCARFVRLDGFTNRTNVLRAIAAALGLSLRRAHSPGAMEPEIRGYLEKTGVILVIDEAHYLFSQGRTMFSRPDLIDWVDTALYNAGIPVVLVATPQFAVRLSKAETEVGWNAEQFKGRVSRWLALPETVTKEDLFAVARKLLPGAAMNLLNFAVGYALTSKRYMSALVDAVDEAKRQAEKCGRNEVTYVDLKTAINDYCIPSDQAKERIFAPAARRQRRLAAPVKRHESPILEPLEAGLNPASEPITSRHFRPSEQPSKRGSLLRHESPAETLA